MTHVDLAAGARLVRLRGADDAGAPRHLSFLAFWVACGSAFWALPELGLYSLRKPLFFSSRLATSTGELYAQPAHGTTDRLRQTSASQAFGLLASVSQYASSAWLPNYLEEVLAAACCGDRFRCKRSLWPSTHADQPWVDALRLWWTQQQNRSKQLSGPSLARRSKRSAWRVRKNHT